MLNLAKTMGLGLGTGRKGAPVVIPAPVVANVFKVDLWTGNPAGQKITSPINFPASGGALITKNRTTAATDHVVFDTIRGANVTWLTDTTGASTTVAQTVTSFDTNGFTLGTATLVNNSGSNFAGWSFAKCPRFFDVITYTGDGSALRAIPHSLGVVPGEIWVKRRDSAGSCLVSHIQNNPGHQYNLLPDANLPTVNDITYGGVPADASNFYLGNSATVNAAGGTYMAYIWAHDPASDGIIQCGKYTGNGSTTGPVVTLGWQPQYVGVRRVTGGTGNWSHFDTTRGIASPGNDEFLSFNLNNAADSTADRLDISSTGFQIKSSATAYNNSGDTYIYRAIRS